MNCMKNIESKKMHYNITKNKYCHETRYNKIKKKKQNKTKKKNDDEDFKSKKNTFCLLNNNPSDLIEEKGF